MIDFNPDQPLMLWNFDSDPSWREDRLGPALIEDHRIRFDLPNQHSTLDDYFVDLRKQQDGTYDGGTTKFRYWGVRADTIDSVILTGNWKAKPGNRPESGIFIALLPKAAETGD